MPQRFFRKEYVLVSLITINSICCFAQEPEITSSPKYYDRSVINRILVKEQLENKSAKTDSGSSKYGSLSQSDEKASGNSFILNGFGARDIFDDDENASFSISLKEAVEMSLNNNSFLNSLLHAKIISKHFYK